MSKCIILTHQYIRENEQDKLDVAHFSLKHHRRNNPNAYIIVVGHGIRPSEFYLNECDHVIWQQDIIENDIGVGHPLLCNKGFDHAIEKGFDFAMKSRLDCINLTFDVLKMCHAFIEEKKILTTQETSLELNHFGDLFIYGSLRVLKKIYNISTWYPTTNGLISLSNNFSSFFDGDRKQMLLKHCAFKDIPTLRWIDLIVNWNELKHHKQDMMKNELSDYHKFLWSGAGYKWDENLNLIQSHHKVETEETWHD